MDRGAVRLEDATMKLLGSLLGVTALGFGAAACSVSAQGTITGTGNGCASDTTLACAIGSTGVDCPSGDNPEAAFPGYVCSSPSPQGDGTQGYCCATGFANSSCAQDDAVAGCAYPSVGFSCSGPDTPDQADGSLACSVGVFDPSSGLTLYCCQ
jgi:hypothetical protein